MFYNSLVDLNQNSPTCCTPHCIKLSAATFVNCLYTIKLYSGLGRYVQQCVTFHLACHQSADNNKFDTLP